MLEGAKSIGAGAATIALAGAAVGIGNVTIGQISSFFFFLPKEELFEVFTGYLVCLGQVIWETLRQGHCAHLGMGHGESKSHAAEEPFTVTGISKALLMEEASTNHHTNTVSPESFHSASAENLVNENQPPSSRNHKRKKVILFLKKTFTSVQNVPLKI